MVNEAAKCEVVEMYWGRCMFGFLMKASAIGDANMKKIIEQVSKIPEEVKLVMIKKYVKKVKEKHALAFMQWRIHYSESKTPKHEM